ncbi:anthranilate synthase component I [[Eubacterium] cellulosolvens]
MAALKLSPPLKLWEIPYRDPLTLFTSLLEEYSNLYLLESVEGPQKLTEFSFIGFDPKELITIKDRKAKVVTDNKESQITQTDALNVVKKAVDATRINDHHLRFVGGAVGYVSYDSIRYWESIPNTAKDDLYLPDLHMGVFFDGVLFNHPLKRAHYFAVGEDRFDQIKRHLNNPRVQKREHFYHSKPKSNISKEDFEESVKKAKHYISEGDIFQVVLSRRFELDFQGSLLNFYTILREINPSPYMYFLKFGKKQIIGSSPEMLVRVENRAIETYPIAGTRPRVSDPERNSALAEELLRDPKERAEHVMLVDLARNDVGRVSDYGSVAVPEFMTVHQYSHVQHIVSKVVGRLTPSHDSFDALRAMLPAGTVSGAPKVRAMEIIEELEPTRRGPYAGAVGYFSFNGNADFAITIRTLVADGERAFIQVGAGIVADSDPEREWYETEQKSEALMKALHQAGVSM